MEILVVILGTTGFVVFTKFVSGVIEFFAELIKPSPDNADLDQILSNIPGFDLIVEYRQERQLQQSFHN